MVVVIVIVFAALFAALFLVRVSRGHAEAISSLDELGGRTQSVDIEAFLNLIDPLETAYLRRSLSGKSLRAVHRARMQAAVEYVERIAQNAAVLLRLGQAARVSPDPEVARAAQAIMDRALVVRVSAMQALIKLKLQILLPGVDLSTLSISERYARLTEAVVVLTRLERPAHAATVMAML
jgi:hypothetical protein